MPADPTPHPKETPRNGATPQAKAEKPPQKPVVFTDWASI